MDSEAKGYNQKDDFSQVRADFRSRGRFLRGDFRLKRDNFKSMKADMIKSGQILGLDGPTLSLRESISGLSELDWGIRLGGMDGQMRRGTYWTSAQKGMPLI